MPVSAESQRDLRVTTDPEPDGLTDPERDGLTTDPERDGLTTDAERGDLPTDPQRDDEELVMFLERDQLVAGKAQLVPRAHLSARTRAALWALRAFVLVVSAMVIYTFFSQLGQ
jgi:hypothetical protein